MPLYEIAFADYKLRAYERVLALREVKGMLPAARVRPGKEGVVVDSGGILADNLLYRLSFFSRYRPKDSDWRETRQKQIEGMNGGKRRNIRYSGHSLHEYKGRFYPQLGKSLINASGVDSGGVVLDPFCGCGTLLLEAALRGVSAVGIDMNPIGCMIARAKIACIKMRPVTVARIRDKIRANSWGHHAHCDGGLDMAYLSRWFPEDNLHQALSVKAWIHATFSGYARILLNAILSDILNRFSYQTPGEQRIRRRHDSPPRHLRDFFCARVSAHLDDIESLSCSRLYPRSADVSVHLGDVRKMSVLNDAYVDCVVTSPPYATALPYIDANRLSLFFFGFADRRKFSALEREMIGSREIGAREKAEYERIVLRGESGLPAEIGDLLAEIHYGNARSSEAGFRRRNMAALLFRYFKAMQKSLREIYRVVKPGGNVSIVVGDNFTVVGGERVPIPTARFLNLIARNQGFAVKHMLPMTPPTAYNIYSKNAVKGEFISVWEKGE